MPSTSSDFPGPSLSSIKPRPPRKVSSSIDSHSSIVRHRIYTRDTFDGSHSLYSLANITSKFAGRNETQKTNHSVNPFDSSSYELAGEHRVGDKYGAPGSPSRHVPDEKQPAITQQGSLTAAKAVDASDNPPEQSSRRTTIFVGPQAWEGHPGPTRDPGGPLQDSDRASIVSCSKMHRPVNEDDYLHARGANPRTGIISPATHSASGSRDEDGAIRKASAPQNRWRQTGDQWLSQDFGQSSPSSSPVSIRSPDHPPRALRTPQKIAATSADIGATGEASASHIRGTMMDAGDVGSPYNLRQGSYAAGPYMETSPRDSERSKPRVSRKPVPPGRSAADESFHPKYGTNESPEIVQRKLRFQGDLRASSAPDPRLHIVAPGPVQKDLPPIPPGSTALSNQEHSHAKDEPFLGLPKPNTPANDQNSKTSNISGPRTLEKELPCLPTSSGPFPLNQDPKTSQMIPKGEGRTKMMDISPPRAEPQGPRGGEAMYPFIRTARPMYPSPPMVRNNALLGERAMPVPVYDNPPRRQLPLSRMPGPRAEGPRAMPIQQVRGPNMMREETGSSWNTTTIPTNMSTSRFMGPPRPVHAGPTSLREDPQMRNHGRLGFPPRAPPFSDSDIIMNTGMSMNTDTMMSIPLPRTRPRAMTRPMMPARAEGTYGIPVVGPSQIRPYHAHLETQQPFRGPSLEAKTRVGLPRIEANLIPEPLRVRVPTPQAATTFHNGQTRPTGMTSNGLGLTRKCSRCHHGFVDVKLHNTDSVIHTSDRPKAAAEANAGIEQHPTGRSLPGLPEEIAHSDSSGSTQSLMKPDKKMSVHNVDSGDHEICCPDCCKEDCHEGCLGHPSPQSTPSPTKSPSMWSEAASQSSASEIEPWDSPGSEKGSEKGKFAAFGFVKTAFKRNLRKDGSKAGQMLNPRAGMQHQPLPPTSHSKNMNMSSNGALAAALTATGWTNPVNKGPHRRQRSSSSPVIGFTISSPSDFGDQGIRAVSGSRLKVPTPAGLAIRCDGLPRSRNVSGNSMTTLELQVPGLGSLGGSALCEMVLVPFEASKMWIKNHPQVMTLGWYGLERGWAMSQIMMTTGWRLWAMVFVYSKTGKLKLNVAKGETAGGFVIDCARSALYFLLFAAASVFIVRVLRIILGVVGIIGWVFKGLAWLLKGILGVGVVR